MASISACTDDPSPEQHLRAPYLHLGLLHRQTVDDVNDRVIAHLRYILQDESNRFLSFEVRNVGEHPLLNVPDASNTWSRTMLMHWFVHAIPRQWAEQHPNAPKMLPNQNTQRLAQFVKGCGTLLWSLNHRCDAGSVEEFFRPLDLARLLSEFGRDVSTVRCYWNLYSEEPVVSYNPLDPEPWITFGRQFGTMCKELYQLAQQRMDGIFLAVRTDDLSRRFGPSIPTGSWDDPTTRD